jgi:hypothetical protein
MPGVVVAIFQCHPLLRGSGMSMELADVTISDVTVTNAAVGCRVQQARFVRVPFSLGGSGLPVLVPTPLFWVGRGSLPCLAAECLARNFLTTFARLHQRTACVSGQRHRSAGGIHQPQPPIRMPSNCHRLSVNTTRTDRRTDHGMFHAMPGGSWWRL